MANFFANIFFDGFTPLILLFFLVMALKGIKKSMADSADERLLRSHPEAWRTRKELEAGIKQRRNEQLGQAAKASLPFLVRLFRK